MCIELFHYTFGLTMMLSNQKMLSKDYIIYCFDFHFACVAHTCNGHRLFLSQTYVNHYTSLDLAYLFLFYSFLTSSN